MPAVSFVAPVGVSSLRNSLPDASRRFAQRLLLALIALFATTSVALAQSSRVSLQGHVLPALTQATPKIAASPSALATPLNFTIVLRRSDPDGFARYLSDVYDAKSPQHLKFMGPLAVSEKFGPGADDFAVVKQYFEQQGFQLVEGSNNRLTLTMSALRAIAERALSVQINDYLIGTRTFYANSTDPVLPAEIGGRVEAIAGLSNLAQPVPQAAIQKWLNKNFYYPYCKATYEANPPQGMYGNPPPTLEQTCGPAPTSLNAANNTRPLGGGAAVPWANVTGAGQKVGLLEFDSFVLSDVANYLNLAGLPAAAINNLSQVHVNGGAPLGAHQDEVLLDITAVMGLAIGAQVVVYDAPFTGSGTSFQTLFNRMVNDHMTVISNSWSYCEDQTSLADVQSIDAIMQAAAASGISVFNASGDSGSTCLDGSANTVGVPASSPNATAVGGTSATVGPGSTYVSESWWNGTTSVPPSGQGGFGVSKFFARPSYQNGFTASAQRSVPDVATNADPANGSVICLATAGGCPTGSFYGGTSVAAPIWAAYAAMLNQAQGNNLGNLNPLLYPLGATTAFHGPAMMGTDFAHVGLGSPNLNLINLALAGQTAGVPVASMSSVVPYGLGANPTAGAPAANPPADGSTTVYVVVRLRDINGNTVSGKTVTLAKNIGSSAIITPASGITSVSDGAFVFTVTNLVAEHVTFTATDTTDGVGLVPHSVTFAVPPATSAGIIANPLTVQNDGVATTTITVTLQDALARPTPGKLITLSQGTGHSLISGPSPSVTNASGQIQFTATDVFNETVTYTAIDVTDGGLPVPGSAVVTFSGTANAPCNAPPLAAGGYKLTLFSSGFHAGNFFYGGVNWGGCPGASNPMFDTSGSVFAGDFPDGNLYRFSAVGGSVTNANVVTNYGPTLGQPIFGKDGSLYVVRSVTSGTSDSGAIAQIDPVTGSVIRYMATGLTCPAGLAVDPISGDLFFDNNCTGVDSPALYRILNTTSTDPLHPPTLSVYVNLPGTPNGSMSFSPDGTLYVAGSYTLPSPPVLKIGGTNTPQPPTITPLAGAPAIYWVTVAETLPGGAAKSLVVLSPPGNALSLIDLTTIPFTITPLTVGGASSGIVGADGCLYFSASYAIYKLTTTAGGCGFASTNPGPTLTLSPSTVSPDPAQGTTQTLVATFNNLSVPVGTGVTFSIQGANQHVRSALTDATGKATTTFPGVRSGTDHIVASATVGALDLVSNSATIVWGAAGGKHVTSVSLNGTIASGTANTSVLFSAGLFDVSVTPNVPVSGATLQFTLNGKSCNAPTNASGVATCSLTLPNAGGLYPLTVSYAGSATLTAASSSQDVGVVVVVVSRKVHGAAGTFDLPLSEVATNPTTEPRQGPSHTIVFSFSNAVTAATASITEGTAIAGAPTFSGSEVIVPLTGVADRQYVTIALSGVDTGTGPTGTASVRIGFLMGDVNQNRVVTVADLGLVNSLLTQPVTGANYLKDINVTGTLTVADKGLTNSNLSQGLPPP